MNVELGIFVILLAAPPVDEEPPADDLSATEATAPEDPGLIQAEALYEAGLTRFKAADYESAVELWLAAYDKVPDTLGSGQIKADIIYNVAKAQQRWYELDRDIAHLRQAKASMQSFMDEIPSSYAAEEVDAELARSKEFIANLDTKILAAEQEARDLELKKAELMRAKFDPVIDERERIRNRGMIISGGLFTGLGVAGLGVLGAGLGLSLAADAKVGELGTFDELDQRRQAFARGEAGNVMTITGAVVAGALLLTGVPLWVVGTEFEKRRLRYKRAYQAKVVPTVTGTGVGLRF